MKNRVLNYKILICSIIHFLLTFISDKLIFDFDNINMFNYFFCKIILLILLIIIWQIIYVLIKIDKYRNYLKNFLIYLLPVLILLFIVWPGTWFGTDVNNFFNLSIKCEYLYYLNYLSSIFYIISLMIFPITSGAIIMLIICFGTVFSYILTNFKKIYNSNICNLLFIPFFLFHTLWYTMFANRPVIYGIFYLLLLSILVIDYLIGNKLSKHKYFILLLLTGLVGFWRSESIYLILSIPLFIFIIYKVKLNFKNILLILGGCIVSFLIISFPQKYYEYQNPSLSPNSRNLPIYISPLSYAVTFELKGDNIEDKLNDINEVLDISSLKKYSSIIDTPCIWNEDSCMKAYNEEQYSKFKKSFLALVRDNPNIFLEAKIKTFLNSTTINGDYFSSYNLFNNDNKLFDRNDSKSFVGNDVRKKVYSLLEGKTRYSILNKIINYSGSLLIPILTIISIFVYSLFSIKKNYVYFLISGMLLAHIMILFITSPAAYFMYYFNIYLCGWFLLILNILKFKEKNSYLKK